MNKNPEALKQYLIDRIGRAGAELREIMGTDTVLLPVTGETVLYVAVGSLAGIAQVAGAPIDEAAGNTNKAVLTDEQIYRVWIDARKKNIRMLSDSEDFRKVFARAIEAAVLSNASKGDVCAQMRALCSACGGTGDVVSIDGEWRGTCNCEASRAAPAPADNPSTAGAAILEENEQYRQQMAGISCAAMGHWKEGEGVHPDYDTVALRDVAKLYAKYDALAAPALNPSDVRDQALEEAARECETRSRNWSTFINEPEYLARGDAGQTCADAIRALKGAAAQSVEGGDRG